MVRYVLGVDGGASKTHALLMDETGCALGFGQAGSGNHQIHGLQHALGEIENAVQLALVNSGLPEIKISLGCYCLAGADLEEDYVMLEHALIGLNLTQSIIVKNDTMAALRAGISRSWGVVVICGTGFNAAGRSLDGKEVVLPGLGPISGDWGGGGDLSQEIIRAVMRDWDGRGKPTLLSDLVLKALQIASHEVLLSKLYHQKINRQQLLDLVPLLFQAAEKDDQIAKEIVVRMGSEVGITAASIIRRLNLQGENVEVVLGGSVFKAEGPLLINTATRIIHEVAPMAKILRPRYEPVVGAALLALEAIGVVVSNHISHELDSTLPEHLYNIHQQNSMC